MNRRPFKLLAGLLLALTVSAPAWAMYNPETGRFLQRDPAGYVDGPNTYEYVRTQPVNRIDPTGKHSDHPEYDPVEKLPLPSGGQIDVTYNRNTIDSAPPCGVIRFTSVGSCNATVTWHESRIGGCLFEKLAYAAVGGDACKLVNDVVQSHQSRPEGVGGKFECPEGKKCCNKRSVNGTYHIKFRLNNYRVSDSCSFSISAQATLGMQGEVGECR